MDEESKALISAVVHEAAAPYRKFAESLIGLVAVDRIEEMREERRERRRVKNKVSTAQEAVQLVQHRQVIPDPETPEEHLEQIFEQAAETSVPELQSLYARLMAAAVDPSRAKFYRKEFVGIVRQFEPLDALVLEQFFKGNVKGDGWFQKIAEVLKRDQDEVFVSGRNLEKLECIRKSPTAAELHGGAIITPLGRQLFSTLED